MNQAPWPQNQHEHPVQVLGVPHHPRLWNPSALSDRCQHQCRRRAGRLWKSTMLVLASLRMHVMMLWNGWVDVLFKRTYLSEGFGLDWSSELPELIEHYTFFVCLVTHQRSSIFNCSTSPDQNFSSKYIYTRTFDWDSDGWAFLSPLERRCMDIKLNSNSRNPSSPLVL